MKQINENDKKEVGELFTNLWNLLKQNYHPENDYDWAELVRTARLLPTGKEDTPLYKLGVNMAADIINFIEENNKLISKENTDL